MSDKQTTETRTSVGVYLRSLREEKNLTIAEVATRLYLLPRVIEALEQDDHESLPSGTYVYGYLQNYAKLLDTPVDRVVAMYKEDIEISEQAEPVTEVQPELKPVQTNKWPYTILYIVIFISILAPITWWWSQYGLERTPQSGLDYPITIVEHPDTPYYRAPNTEQVEQEHAAAGEVAEPQTVGQQATESQPPEAQIANTEKDIEAAPSTYDENTITTGIGPDSIRIVLLEECWIEIFDAGNEKIFYDLARPGQTLELNGTAPFSVLLGNGAVATVEFNNLPFDTTPHRSRIGMARFVLGEDQ